VPYEQNTLLEITHGFQYVLNKAQGNQSAAGAIASAYSAVNSATADSGGHPLGDLRAIYQSIFDYANTFGPAIKLTTYEGGWSPDYEGAFNGYAGFITGATNASSCVLTIATTSFKGTLSGNPCVVGMPLVIGGVVGMTQLNCQDVNVTFNAGGPGSVTWTAHGLLSGQQVTFSSTRFFGGYQICTGVTPGLVYYVKTVIDANHFTISATNGGTVITIDTKQSATGATCWVVTAVSGSSVTINANSTGFGSYTSGGFASFGTYDPGGGSAGAAMYLNQLRYASKFTPEAAAFITKNNSDVIAVGGDFPSQFIMAGNGVVWSVWEPDIYLSSTPSQWTAIVDFNN
jgi:hypothetical protein